LTNTRVPLYQPMQAVMARRAPVLAGQGCRSMRSSLIMLGQGVVPALAGVADSATTTAGQPSSTLGDLKTGQPA
jgi:hypothetical protein